MNIPNSLINTPRAQAWQCLQSWARGTTFAETLIDNAAYRASIKGADRAFLQAIVYGTLRQQSWLDSICRSLRPQGLEEQLYWLVMSGLCQLFIMEQAEYAVVSETVNLAPARGRGLVNGMLREALRRKESILEARETLPLDIRYSCPKWLVERWVKQLGLEETQAMLAWNIDVPPVYARLNPLQPMNEIPESWEAIENLDGWYKMKGALPVAALNAGQVYVADPSTRHCVNLLAPRAGEKILDACAAPGGKAAAILAATGGDVELLATDLQVKRLKSLEENLLRAGGKTVEVAAHDWTKGCPQKYLGQFDAVLLDVPCSNTGVLQRRVDARWRVTQQEIERLADLQLCIMECAAPALRPGGRLVYSTCSIDAEENRSNVERFLARNPEFTLVEEYLALPHREQADGAYAALLLYK